MEKKSTVKNMPVFDGTTLDHLIEGYQLIGFDWKYLFVNESVVKQSKFSDKADLLGYTMMEKYPGIENTKLFEVLSNCMENRVSTTMLNEFDFPDGSKGWFELRIEPVPRGIFILSMDVTEQKKAELLKKEYTNSLEKMIFMTSHKVRQPVCNILEIVDVLNEGNIDENELKEIIGHMEESIKNLDEFTRDLTTFIHEKKIEIDIDN